MTRFQLSGRVFVLTLILLLSFGAVSSERAASVDGEEELILGSGFGPTQDMLVDTCQAREIVSVAQCQERYQKGGTFRRMCCSSACHRADVVCFDHCVRG